MKYKIQMPACLTCWDKDVEVDVFWNVIIPPVFVELLINGIENYGKDMGHDDCQRT